MARVPTMCARVHHGTPGHGGTASAARAQDGAFKSCPMLTQKGPPCGLSVQVTGCEVRAVVASDAAVRTLAVVDIDVAANDHATLHTSIPHPFSGAKQLVAVAGLGEGLDGSYAVVAAAPNTSEFRIKLPAATAAAAAADELKRRAQQGLVSARCAVGPGGLCMVPLPACLPVCPPACPPACLPVPYGSWSACERGPFFP